MPAGTDTLQYVVTIDGTATAAQSVTLPSSNRRAARSSSTSRPTRPASTVTSRSPRSAPAACSAPAASDARALAARCDTINVTATAMVLGGDGGTDGGSDGGSGDLAGGGGGCNGTADCPMGEACDLPSHSCTTACTPPSRATAAAATAACAIRATRRWRARSDRRPAAAAPATCGHGVPDARGTTRCGCTTASDCLPNQACNTTTHTCGSACDMNTPCNGGCCSAMTGGPARPARRRHLRQQRRGVRRLHEQSKRPQVHRGHRRRQCGCIAPPPIARARRRAARQRMRQQLLVVDGLPVGLLLVGRRAEPASRARRSRCAAPSAASARAASATRPARPASARAPAAATRRQTARPITRGPQRPHVHDLVQRQPAVQWRLLRVVGQLRRRHEPAACGASGGLCATCATNTSCATYSCNAGVSCVTNYVTAGTQCLPSNPSLCLNASYCSGSSAACPTRLQTCTTCCKGNGTCTGLPCP